MNTGDSVAHGSQKRLAIISQDNIPAGLLDEANPELGLKVGDPVRERRARHTQISSGPGKGANLRKGR